MALTADKKVAIAQRIHDLATKKYGSIRPTLIFDALTLPISTGQEDYRTAGIETLKAVERDQEGAAGGEDDSRVSATSRSAWMPIRGACLNSVFMHEAVDHGLDMAIVNYTKIYPLYKIPAGGSRSGAQADLPRRSSGDPSAGLHGALRRNEGQTAASTTAHVDTLIGRRQAEVCNHQRREIDWRWRKQKAAGTVTGRRPGDYYAAGTDQHRPAGRHEDGRRPVRRTQDAAAVGAGFGRGDEGTPSPISSRRWRRRRARRRAPSCSRR